MPQEALSLGGVNAAFSEGSEDAVQTVMADIDFIGAGSDDKTFMCAQIGCWEFGLWYA
jgi:hypothetical protein